MLFGLRVGFEGYNYKISTSEYLVDLRSCIFISLDVSMLKSFVTILMKIFSYGTFFPFQYFSNRDLNA